MGIGRKFKRDQTQIVTGKRKSLGRFVDEAGVTKAILHNQKVQKTVIENNANIRRQQRQARRGH